MTGPGPLRPWRALAATALFAAWFLAFTGARPLTVPDEGRYAEVAREMVVSGDWVTPQLNGVPFLDKPPLLYWLDAAGFELFGAHAWSARLAPALLAALGCLLVLLAGARLFGARAGLLAALILAANPYYFGASQYVNHDLAVAVWISAALLAFAVAFPAGRPARPGWIWAGSAAAALAVLTKGLIGILFPFGIAGLWLLWTRRLGRTPWAALGGGLLLLAVLVLPWLLAVQAAHPGFFHYFFVTQQFERFTGKGFNNPMGPGFYLAVLAVGLLPWSPQLVAALRRAAAAFRRDREEGGADLLLLLWPAAVLLFFSIPRSKIAGYALPAVPPLALLLGRWWDGLLSAPAAEPPRSLRVSAGAMVGIALGLLVVPPLLHGRAAVPRPALLLLAATGAGTLAAGIGSWVALRRRRYELAFAGHVAFAALFCAGALLAVPHLVRDGTRPLAERIRPLLRDGDAVVCYRRYFYDLPFYLGRREPLAVVDDWSDPEIPRQDSWRRELWLGLRWRPEAAAWMVGPDRLAGLCGGTARCFVVALRRDLPELESRVRLVPLAETGDRVLLASPAAHPGPAERAAPAPSAPSGAARSGL